MNNIEWMAQFQVPQIVDSKEEMLACHARIHAALQQPPADKLILEDLVKIRDSSLFYLAYHGVDIRPLFEEFARFCREVCPELEFRAPHGDDPPAFRRGRKIRIGFISKYFFNHTIANLYSGIITHFDRERFHVIQLQFAQKSDRLVEVVKLFGIPSHLEALDWIVKPRADETITLSPEFFEAREAIAHLELDILFYTDIGMNALTYFLAFSRLAPIQCTSWGHPVTSGLPTIEYFLSTAGLEPDGAQSHYTEKLISLSHLPTFYYRPTMAGGSMTRADFALDPGAHLYLCPQSLFKVHPDFDAILSGILEEDRRGKIVFIESAPAERPWQEKLLQRFRRTLPRHFERIIFVPRQSSEGFWRLTEIADVLLDTIHFSGGKTTHDALAMGIPIVTQPGGFMRGRVTAACFQKMDMPDCVAASAEDYVSQAVRLAADRGHREALRKKILARNPVLFENMGAVREIDRFLVRAVEGFPLQQ